jgi:glycosyltransferase involved in cell wall biosynthesis
VAQGIRGGVSFGSPRQISVDASNYYCLKEEKVLLHTGTGSLQIASRRRRVWVITELYYPELTSTGYFLTGIAEGLADLYDVSVLCGQPSYWARGVRAPSREIRNGVDVERCRATTFEKNKLIGRAFNLLTISFSIFITALSRFRRGDIAIVVTNPPLLPYIVALACRVRGARFVLLVHDVYPEILERLDILKPQSLLMRLLHRVSERLYQSADRILVLGRDMQDLIQQKLSSRRDRVAVATNWASTEMIAPTPRSDNQLLGRLHLEGKFVVQFFGNMGRPHCIEDILDAAELLSSDLEIHFLIVGWGAKKNWAVNEKNVRHLENMTIIDPLEREQSCDVQNACDLAINTLSSNMSGISVPSRTYNVMASGKPMLAVCDEDSELATVIYEEQTGWVVPPGRPDILAATIRKAKAAPEELRLMGERAYQAAEAKYTIASVLKVYTELIEGLIAE